jgi:hypothetical protein
MAPVPPYNDIVPDIQYDAASGADSLAERSGLS